MQFKFNSGKMENPQSCMEQYEAALGVPDTLSEWQYAHIQPLRVHCENSEFTQFTLRCCITIIIFMALSWQSDFILLHPRAVPKFAPSKQKMFEGFHTVNNKLLEQEQQ